VKRHILQQQVTTACTMWLRYGLPGSSIASSAWRSWFHF